MGKRLDKTETFLVYIGVISGVVLLFVLLRNLM